MKYQKLVERESGWAFDYLVRKYKAGINISKYKDKDIADKSFEQLISYQYKSDKIIDWINNNLNPELNSKLKQTIRSKRKRYFNSEHIIEKKKSIDIDYNSWIKLTNYAKTHKITLSEAINKLIGN